MSYKTQHRQILALNISNSNRGVYVTRSGRIITSQDGYHSQLWRFVCGAKPLAKEALNEIKENPNSRNPGVRPPKNLKLKVTVGDLDLANFIVTYSKKEDPIKTRSVRAKWHNSKGKTSNTSFRFDDIKSSQSDTLQEFRQFNSEKNYRGIREMHFDWWMFPTEDQRKKQFNILENDMLKLKSDRQWMENYRESVKLVAKSWGWDTEKRQFSTPNLMPVGDLTDIRLSKMIRSLWLFGEKELMESIQELARNYKPQGRLYYGGICLDEVYFMKL